MKPNGPRTGRISRQRPTLTKKDNDLAIGTWNVRTLNRPGAIRQLMGELNKVNMHITAVQETRWPGRDIYSFGENVFYYSGNKVEKQEGTGFIISKNLRNAVLDFKPINGRLCTMRFKNKFFNITFINIHAPTEEKEEVEKEQFYDLLERVYDQAPSHDIKIIIGDVNAQIGKEDSYMPTIGKHSLHEVSNDNGNRIIQFAISKNMVIKSTFYPHKDIHKGTWVSPDGSTVNQIDHIIIDGRHSSSILDVRSYRGPNIDSDHFLVKSRFRARISQKCNNLKKPSHKYKTDLLQNEKIREEYERSVATAMSTVNLENNINDLWLTISSRIKTAADNVIGLKEKRKRNDWYDDECQTLMNLKNEARKKMLQRATRSNVEDYKNKRREEKKLFKKKKLMAERKIHEEIEDLHKKQDTRSLYQLVNKMRGSFQQQSIMCRNKEGNILSSEEESIERWAEHFRELLNCNPTPASEVNTAYHTAQPYIKDPSFEEVQRAIKKIKNNKAAGSDSIPGELIKYGGEELSKTLHYLIIKIWKEECLPEEWGKGIICPIYKKNDRLQCDNYRGITLLNLSYKIFANILYQRLLVYAEEVVGDYQCGFRNNRSTIDQLFSIRHIMEKCSEYNIDTHHLFIDFRAAYDSVSRNILWNSMEELGIPSKLIKLTKITLENVTSQVRIQNVISKPFQTLTGLRQGDPLATLLFNLTLENVIRKVSSNLNLNLGNTIYAQQHQILAYADDLDIIGKNEATVRKIFESLEREAGKAGLQINETKTKYMEVAKQPRHRDEHLLIGNYKFGKVKSFTYLGAIVNQSNNLTEEIKTRISLGNRSCFALHKLLKSNILSRKVKFILYKTLIRPIVLYGSETWCLTKEVERLIGAFERKILRRILGPIREQEGWRIRYNHELYTLYEEPDIVKTVKINRIRWLGHLQRMENSRGAKQLFLRRPHGKRSAGRPRTRWLDNVQKDLQHLGIKNWQEVAMDRNRWKRLVKEAKTPDGL